MGKEQFTEHLPAHTRTHYIGGRDFECKARICASGRFIQGCVQTQPIARSVGGGERTGLSHVLPDMEENILAHSLYTARAEKRFSLSHSI